MLPAAKVCFIISSDASIPKAIPSNKAHMLLGQECDLLIFDAHSGLEVNALAAVSGTLCGGGILGLLTPPLEQWSHYPDPAYKRFLPYPYTASAVKGLFLQRFIRLLATWQQTQPAVTNPDSLSQAQVIELMLTTSLPVVLTADRGRGKSAALGIVASHLSQQGQRVIVTAPSKATITTLFRHAHPYEPVLVAPDELLQTLPHADVLLVDEAAAIPLSMLVDMRQHYPRCIFSTTVHGYEGSGRGFVLRFLQQLQELGAYAHLRLHQPMRWADNDPLEQFINRALLLSADIPEQIGVVTDSPQYKQLDREVLATDEMLLQQVFGLLVNAHYQTRPSDLRQLLDAPAMSVHVLSQGEIIVAVALLSREGGLDKDLTAAIHAGKRRPHGHPIPQTLTFHAGIAHAAELICERIMRIAVLPILQGRGLGRQLLQAILHYAQKQGADYMGVSYAQSPELTRFWQQAGFSLARVGHRKDTASGSQSAVQIYPFTTAGYHLQHQCTVQLTRPV